MSSNIVQADPNDLAGVSTRRVQEADCVAPAFVFDNYRQRSAANTLRSQDTDFEAFADLLTGLDVPVSTDDLAVNRRYGPASPGYQYPHLFSHSLPIL